MIVQSLYTDRIKHLSLCSDLGIVMKWHRIGWRSLRLHAPIQNETCLLVSASTSASAKPILAYLDDARISPLSFSPSETCSTMERRLQYLQAAPTTSSYKFTDSSHLCYTQHKQYPHSNAHLPTEICCQHTQNTARRQPNMHSPDPRTNYDVQTPNPGLNTRRPANGIQSHAMNFDYHQDPSMWLQEPNCALNGQGSALESAGASYNMNGHAYSSSSSGIDPRHLHEQTGHVQKQEEPNVIRSEESSYGDTTSHLLNDFSTHEPHFDNMVYMRGGYVHQEPSSSMSPPNTAYDQGYADDGSEYTEPYNKLLHKCLMEAPDHELQLKDIYDWFRQNTGKGHTPNEKGWQNSIRHNLSMNPVSQYQTFPPLS